MAKIKVKYVGWWSFIMIIFTVILSVHMVSAEDQNASPITFPIGDLFDSLIADPKQPRFYASAQHFNLDQGDNYFIGMVGVGETIGLIRWLDEVDKVSWQLSIAAGVFAQFDLDSGSNDLLNTDYTVGLSGTRCRDQNSMRIRLYHLSAHLGDEILLRNERFRENRKNVRYDAIEMIGSRKWDKLRVYAGGSYLIYRSPGDLERAGIQIGTEYYDSKHYWRNSRLVGGLDLKSFEYNDWEPSISLKMGLEFGKTGSRNRHIRFMIEGYDGFVPFGQFYDEKCISYGIGIYLDY